MKRVFISYRREDSAGHAGRLFDRLAERLGRERVFRDVDHIRPGDLFTEAIREKIGASDILLVLIGPRWLAATDQEGRRRLEDPDDLVRREIEMGLGRKMRIIPVLLGGAAMPVKRDLPESLQPLAGYSALEIRDANFDQDAARLIADTGAGWRRNRFAFLRSPAFAVPTLAAAAVALGVFAFWQHPGFLITADRARAQLGAMGLSYDAGSFVSAARAGDAGAVALFLKAGMKPDETEGDDTAFESALDEGHVEIARALIQAGADVNRSLPAAASSGNQELFRLLLAKKPTQRALENSLFRAASSGKTEIVKQLLDLGVDPNSAAGFPLGSAAYYGYIDLVKLLLARGADVNGIDRGGGGRKETALHYASRGTAHSVEMTGLLLGSGAKVNVQDQGGTTPLMNALDRREVALMLLAAGADVNLRTNDGATALMYAAGRHLTGLIKILLDKGADIHAQDGRGRTPLMYTSGAIDRVDDPNTVEVLVDNGAGVNRRDRDDYTALMYAAQGGLPGAVRVLLRGGADRGAKNNRGQTALALATAARHEPVIAMLGGAH